ncbi:MAG: EscU/YscU/HrcU family type III secretion system export apparatus switch protein, partial [Paracoccus sp. (in: a-proteobacteria)]
TDDLGERTEDATPRRLREARTDGKVASSRDLGSAIALLLGTVATSALVPFFWLPVAAGDLSAFAALALFGTASQYFLVRAFTVAEAGVLAPFGYTGLVWAGFWGWLFFGQLPDRWTVAGAALIVGAGLYVWSREAGAARKDR